MDLLEFNRRQLLKGSGKLLTLAALGNLYAEENGKNADYLIPAKAKRVIYLTYSGGPSQLDLYDYKPDLKKWHGKELPPSVRGDQRITTMTSNQGHLKIAASAYQFIPHKKTGLYHSELIPHFSSISDDICVIKSMHTNEINHDPGICYLTTGSNRPGKPSIGSWVSYGLGSLNENLPSYITMISQTGRSNQSINARLWGSGFLPSQHQGTRFYSGKEPVLFLKNPENISNSERKNQIELIKSLNQIKYTETKNSEILSRSSQYELAFKMQTSVPEVTDISNESEKTLNMYGPESKTPGSFAYNCLIARKLAEKNVRFIQLFHRGWDHHEFLPQRIVDSCQSTDQPAAALVKDLKMRGLLDDTLIICAGEFGRTTYCQGDIGAIDYGRDHHGKCYSIWMAGAGIKKGFSYGETDEFSYNVTSNPVSIEELNATILHLIGIKHERFSFFHRGLEEKLTGIEPVKPVKGILS